MGGKGSCFSWISTKVVRDLNPLRSKIVGLRHLGKPTGPWLEVCSPSLMMRGRADQGGEGPFDQLALNGPDPDKRVRHRRSTGVEPIGRR